MLIDSLSHSSVVPTRLRINGFSPARSKKATNFSRTVSSSSTSREFSLYSTQIRPIFPSKLSRPTPLSITAAGTSMKQRSWRPICRAQFYWPRSRRGAITRSMEITESPKHGMTESPAFPHAGSAARNISPFSRPHEPTKAMWSTGIRRSRSYGRKLGAHRWQSRRFWQRECIAYPNNEARVCFK
jgi:hypothetical protein